MTTSHIRSTSWEIWPTRMPTFSIWWQKISASPSKKPRKALCKVLSNTIRFTDNRISSSEIIHAESYAPVLLFFRRR